MGVELVPDTTHVAPGETLGFVLINNGPGQIYFDEAYQVQRQQAGEWVDANVEQPGLYFTRSLRTMPVADTFAQILTLRDDVLPGRYRVTKGVGTEASERVTLSFEFEIDRPAGSD